MVMSEINIICFVYRPIVLMLQSLNCPPDLPSTNRYANKLGFFYGFKLIFQHFNKIYFILNLIYTINNIFVIANGPLQL